MIKTFTRTMTLAALLSLPLAGGMPARAQDSPAPKDDALDSLLRKLEDKDSAPEKTDAPPPDAAKPAEGREKTPPAEAPKGGKPAGEVSGKDKDLDSLLEKLGATEDKPSPDERRPTPGGAGEPDRRETPPPDKPGPGAKRPDSLTGKAKDLDEHLEELTGKRRKKDRREEEDEGSPLSDVIKQMREVEERLGKPDTGEQTRQKQTQIVKRIEELIEQARSSSSQSRRTQRRNLAMRPGEQPGGQQDQPGTTGGNAPFTKPQKPTDRRSAAGGKDVWGHLPPELRNEMDNVSKEDPLPSREELIKRYYLSVSQKNLSRGR